MQIQSPFELILFGGLGDLAQRKLLPALYLLQRDGRLPDGKIFSVSRKTMERDAFIGIARTALKKHVSREFLDAEALAAFEAKLEFLSLDVTNKDSFKAMKKVLSNQCPNRLYYYATGSDLFLPTSAGLAASGLIRESDKVVLEKPIGNDLESALKINKDIAQYFDESQIYRIDHYLGKETVQNLMVLRFANSLFESQWNQKFIDHIQITIGESLGVEKRADFYEQVGAMRDMFQNHLLQLLCIVAMEPPARMEADAIRDEKVKVLRSLKPILGDAISKNVVRGQYDSGVSEGKPVPRYRDEPGVHPKSRTETFVAAKVEIKNWRWAGVPFYLRTGKRLPERVCEIVVNFKEIPHSIFPLQHKNTMANRLIFRLQPDDGVSLMLCEKRIGPGMSVRPMRLSLNPTNLRKDRVPEAYERLLFDALNSNPTLFLRDDELVEAWRWVDPILQYWHDNEIRFEPYTSGTWGPAASTLLLARDGRLWEENS